MFILKMQGEHNREPSQWQSACGTRDSEKAHYQQENGENFLKHLAWCLGIAQRWTTCLAGVRPAQFPVPHASTECAISSTAQLTAWTRTEVYEHHNPGRYDNKATGKLKLKTKHYRKQGGPGFLGLCEDGLLVCLFWSTLLQGKEFSREAGKLS